MSRPWTDAEQRILTIHYPDKGPDGIAKLLPRRSRIAIIQTACRLGVRWKLHPTCRAWPAKDIEILREVYPVTGSRGAQLALPHRTRSACRVMARRLGLYRYGPRKRAAAAVKQDNRPLTFEEKLALVASGRVSIVPSRPRLHLEPTIRVAA